ncbi:hypothetical protein JKP88DRAFT_250739 [Tribonema minus]|uniref:Uncharacterized protein n=1 Tax=Tribonema minus TaxID=303371 RepID=A0A835ZF67_9STRA|nr:hypothetical protein JKP88DRAFT_250739 [Tribonema minus]
MVNVYNCPHNLSKPYCRKCGGSAYCEHGTRKRDCRLGCGGGSFCEHNKRKEECAACGGSQSCLHGKLKKMCREPGCGGSAYCSCGIRKQMCPEHGGSGLCVHKINKRMCYECGTADTCESEACMFYPYKERTIAHKTFEGRRLCYRCEGILNPNALRKFKVRREHIFTEYVLDQLPEINEYLVCTDKAITDGCSQHRPDIMFDMLTHIIDVEFDENGHSSKTKYPEVCQNKRTMSVFESMANRPMYILRINPDGVRKLYDGKVSALGEPVWAPSIHFGNVMKDFCDQLKIMMTKIPDKEIKVVKINFKE